MSKRTLGCLLLAVCAAAGWAAPAYDDADDPVYSGGWSNGLNGGYGWQPWTNVSEGSIQPGTVLGTAWNLNNDYDYAFATAIRYLAAPMSVGETLLIDFRALTIEFGNWGDASWGIRLVNSSGEELLALFDYRYGPGQFWLSDNTGNHITGVPAGDVGYTLAVTLTGANTYYVDVSGLYQASGSLKTTVNGGPIAGVDVFNYNTDHDLYLNKMRVVPEPSAIALLGPVLLGMFLGRRKSR